MRLRIIAALLLTAGLLGFLLLHQFLPTGEELGIVSLSPEATEILFALGLGDSVVGVTEHCDYPQEATLKPRVGGFATINIEAVVALRPSLVIGSARIHSKVASTLEGGGVEVLLLDAKSVEDVLKNIELVGQRTGRLREARGLVSKLRGEVEQLRRKVEGCFAEGRCKPKRVFLVIWHDPLTTAGGDTFVGDLIRVLGSVNIAANLSGYSSYSVEVLIEERPDAIIIFSHGGGVPEGWRPELPTMPLILYLSGGEEDVCLRAGPRIARCLEQLAGFLYPELGG